MHPRHASTTCIHDILPRHASTTYIHDIHPRHISRNGPTKVSSLVVECITALYDWVRAGPSSKDERVHCLKSLGRRPDESDGTMTEDCDKCQSLVVEALVLYAKGKEGAKVFPYGDRASKHTEDFLRLASPPFTITLSCMYPFIVEDKDMWKILLKNYLYPIKQLWPKGVLKRYINFNDVFSEQRKEMFDTYERAGGVYHGDGESSSDENDSNQEKEYEDVELDCDKDF